MSTNSSNLGYLISIPTSESRFHEHLGNPGLEPQICVPLNALMFCINAPYPPANAMISYLLPGISKIVEPGVAMILFKEVDQIVNRHLVNSTTEHYIAPGTFEPSISDDLRKQFGHITVLRLMNCHLSAFSELRSTITCLKSLRELTVVASDWEDDSGSTDVGADPPLTPALRRLFITSSHRYRHSTHALIQWLTASRAIGVRGIWAMLWKPQELEWLQKYLDMNGLFLEKMVVSVKQPDAEKSDARKKKSDAKKSDAAESDDAKSVSLGDNPNLRWLAITDIGKCNVNASRTGSTRLRRLLSSITSTQLWRLELHIHDVQAVNWSSISEVLRAMSIRQIYLYDCLNANPSENFRLHTQGILAGVGKNRLFIQGKSACQEWPLTLS